MQIPNCQETSGLHLLTQRRVAMTLSGTCDFRMPSAARRGSELYILITDRIKGEDALGKAMQSREIVCCLSFPKFLIALKATGGCGVRMSTLLYQESQACVSMFTPWLWLQ